MTRRRGTSRARRKVETKQLQSKFNEIGAGRRYNLFKSPPWERRNPLVKLLMEAHVATGEPSFLEALKVAERYGFTEAIEPRRRIREVGILLASRGAIPFVEEELQRQREAGERQSYRRACEWAAVEAAVEAPTLEAARKRVATTYDAHLRGQIPDGNTGRMLLVATICGFPSPECMEVPVNKVAWYPDNVDTRSTLAHRPDCFVLDRAYKDWEESKDLLLIERLERVLSELKDAEEAAKNRSPHIDAEIWHRVRQASGAELMEGPERIIEIITNIDERPEIKEIFDEISAVDDELEVATGPENASRRRTLREARRRLSARLDNLLNMNGEGNCSRDNLRSGAVPRAQEGEPV
jgi:hypothetical protein